jgi:hypothetical protein
VRFISYPFCSYFLISPTELKRTHSRIYWVELLYDDLAVHHHPSHARRMELAVDEAVLEHASRGNVLPILRLLFGIPLTLLKLYKDLCS